jgi:hypothetical protein
VSARERIDGRSSERSSEWQPAPLPSLNMPSTAPVDRYLIMAAGLLGGGGVGALLARVTAR